jgi:hypothetical protein
MDLITTVKSLLLFFSTILAFNYFDLSCQQAISVGIFIVLIYLSLESFAPSHKVTMI